MDAKAVIRDKFVYIQRELIIAKSVTYIQNLENINKKIYKGKFNNECALC